MAKATSLAVSLGKHLECAVCFEQYTEPKVLPCLHSFCRRCLQRLLTRAGAVFKIDCPTCRSRAEIPQGQIDLLPVNFFVNNLLSMVALHEDSDTGKLGCDNCDSEEPPVSRCATCSLFLCDFCNEAHRRGRSTRSHSLMSLEEAKKMGSVAKPAICKEHEGEVMKLFCETCEEAICRDCTIVKHRDHKYTFVKDAFPKRKESLLKILSEAKTKATVLKEAVDNVSKMERNVYSCAKQTVQEVTNCFNELTACLDGRRTQLIGKVEEFKKAKLHSLKIQKEKLETSLASVLSSVEFTEKALENGSEVEILNIRKQMSSRLHDLNSTKWQLEPCVNEELKCKGDNNQLKRSIATFGAVSDVVTHAAISTVTMENGQEGVMYSTLCGQPVKFNIIAKECNGRKRKEGGDIFEVSIENEKQKVKDCGNGMYSFSLTPCSTGQYRLFVQMKGRHVQGSPFQWCVEKWNLASSVLHNSEGHLNLSEKNLTAQYIELAAPEEEQVIGWPELLKHEMLIPEMPKPCAPPGFPQFPFQQNPYEQVRPCCPPSYSRKHQHMPPNSMQTMGKGFLQHSFLPHGPSGEANSDKKVSVVGSVGFKNGKHMWKVQIHGKTMQGFSFGIVHANRDRNGKLVKLGNMWVWNAQDTVLSSITDCASGDIIELYLDFEDGTLRMYNPRNQQSDTWRGVKGEVTPVFHMATFGDKVSLMIPQKA